MIRDFLLDVSWDRFNQKLVDLMRQVLDVIRMHSFIEVTRPRMVIYNPTGWTIWVGETNLLVLS